MTARCEILSLSKGPSPPDAQAEWTSFGWPLVRRSPTIAIQSQLGTAYPSTTAPAVARSRYPRLYPALAGGRFGVRADRGPGRRERSPTGNRPAARYRDGFDQRAGS